MDRVPIVKLKWNLSISVASFKNDFLIYSHLVVFNFFAVCITAEDKFVNIV